MPQQRMKMMMWRTVSMRKFESVFDKFPKYHMKISLGDFHAKVGREDIFKVTIGN
jgi:hypothetical protein